MVLMRRFRLISEIAPRKNASSPNRTGTLTSSLFLKSVGLSFCSMTLLMSNRIALDPMSIAANFRMTKFQSFRIAVSSDSNGTIQIEILILAHPLDAVCTHCPVYLKTHGP